MPYYSPDEVYMNYELLCSQLYSLIGGVPHRIANLANAAALLFNTLEKINWAGFYFIENGVLVLGPFQGKHACIEIPLGRGVCGTAAEKNETVTVKNVHDFPGHIACDSASASEIVIPLRQNGKVIGVLDIDSPVLNRFSESDRQGLEKFAEILEEELFNI